MEQPNPKMWTTVYPAYLNSNHLKSKGRKVPKTIAVENPTLMEISEVLTFFKLHHCLENKAYPRDILERGRVKVKLFDDTKTALNSEIPNKTLLLRKLCEYIPRLKSRIKTEEVKTEPKKKTKNKKKK